MYKKYLVVSAKTDLAGMNIAQNLSQFKENPVLANLKDSPNFDIYLAEDEVIHNKNLDLEKINKYDFIIFATKHKSEKGTKSLSVHAPGNWRNADYGGEKGKICKISAMFQKQMFELLKKYADENFISREYEITLECTHHGPLIEKPCIFIEIGSSERDWKDRRAGFVIAKTIRDVIKNFKPSLYNEVAIAIGGPHYCPNFNLIQLNSNVAISHIIPQYSLPVDEKMIREAIDNTEEEVDFALIDWKGIGNAESRKQIIDILDKLYIRYKRIGEI
jgi:D-aminoacyl-tRNA deacylase